MEEATLERAQITQGVKDYARGFPLQLACEVPGAGFGSVMSVTADIAYVEKEKLSVVVGTDEYQINNKHDARFSPLPKAKIVRRAEEMVGQVLRYSIITSNCEHFVTKIRYGEARSDQVRDAVAYTIGGVALAGLVGGIFWMASKNKQRNREDDY
ncbi:HRAS-like suppressor 3 [Varanus komodoensis]|nr:HRAS-like suppressor 3 [Varanus komodoensis]